MFKNNNQQSINKLTAASVKTSRRRNIFVILTIALSTCMIMVVALYFMGIRQENERALVGRYQAGTVDVDEETIARLKSLDSIESVGLYYYIESVGIDDYKLTFSYIDETLMLIGKYPDVQGSLPQSEDEVMVVEDYLKHINSSATVGDTILLNIDGEEKVYTISGILPLESAGRSYSVYVSRAFINALDDAPLFSTYFNITNAANMGVEELEKQIKLIGPQIGLSERDVIKSAYYFTLIEPQSAADILIIAGVFLIVAFACALVIYSLFYVSVIGKTNEYGRLRIIGTTKKQIRKIVFMEGLYLSSIAIPIGIILGAVGAYILKPDGFSILTTIIVAFIVAATIYVIVVLATRKPVKIASKITPIEALRNTASSDSMKETDTKQLHRSLTPSRLASINLKRNKKKSILTVSSLGVCGILLMASSSYLNSIDYEDMARLTMPAGEFQINLGFAGPMTFSAEEYALMQQNNLLDDQLKEDILSVNGVESIKEYNGINLEIQYPSTERDSGTIEGYVQDDADLLQSKLVEGTADYLLLAENNGILVNGVSMFQTVYDWNVKLGDKLYIRDSEGNNIEFVVMGILKETAAYGGTGNLYIPDSGLQELQREVSNFNYRIVIEAADNKRDPVEAALRLLIAEEPDLEMSTLMDSAAVLESSMNNLEFPIYAIVIFIGIFGIINLLNTLITNMLVRKKELSVFQTLGLSNKQLSNMLLMEGLFYSLGTIGITMTIGTGAGYLLCKIFDTIGAFGKVTYKFPVWQICLYFAILLTLQISFSYLSIRAFKKQSLVERISDI